MKWVAGVVFFGLALSAYASDDTRWRRVAEVDQVEITVNVVTRSELAKLQRQHVQRQGGFSALSQSLRLHGLAVLTRNTASGIYSCNVYVLSANDADAVEHETKHCYGWVH